MRKLVLTLHLYIGLTVAVVMAILAMTGAFLVFELSIDHSLNAGMDHVKPQGQPIPLDRLRDSLEERFPGYLVTEIILPESVTSSALFHVDSTAARKGKDLYLDPYTGSVLGTGSQRNHLTRKIRLLHTQLLAGAIGNGMVTWSTVGLSVLGVTGLLLWWPRKVFTIRRRVSLFRLNSDLHHCIGFWTSWAMVLFAATGLVIHTAHTPESDPFQSGGTRTEPPKRASLAQVVSASQQTFRDGVVTRIDLPLNPSELITVTVRLPEDHTPLGRSSAKVDASTGAVVAALSTREAPLRYKIFKLWARELHTGDVGGWPGKVLAATCSLALALLALSGTGIWFIKKLAARRGRAALLARTQQQTPTPVNVRFRFQSSPRSRSNLAG